MEKSKQGGERSNKKTASSGQLGLIVFPKETITQIQRTHFLKPYTSVTPHILSGNPSFVIYLFIANNVSLISSWWSNLLYMWGKHQSHKWMQMNWFCGLKKKEERKKHTIKSGARVGKPHHVCTQIFYKNSVWKKTTKQNKGCKKRTESRAVTADVTCPSALSAFSPRASGGQRILACLCWMSLDPQKLGCPCKNSATIGSRQKHTATLLFISMLSN